MTSSKDPLQYHHERINMLQKKTQATISCDRRNTIQTHDMIQFDEDAPFVFYISKRIPRTICHPDPNTNQVTIELEVRKTEYIRNKRKLHQVEINIDGKIIKGNLFRRWDR